ncbi:MAG: NAD(P)/FAD-dependent oxidoreductase [Pseudomonadota bacterium]
MENNLGTAHVAIVGGGNLGVELAKALEGAMQVSLIDRARAFTHAPAMIRAVVDPRLLDRALIPYDNVMSTGTFINGDVTAVDGTGATLSDGTKIAADYVVLATGSGNLPAFKSMTGDIPGLRAASAAWHQAIVDASTIAIIGAGAVGTELAGEIASAMPDKSVSLISSDERLFPGFPQRLGDSLTEKLRTMKVDVILGERATELPDGMTPGGGTVTLSSGRTIDADLIVPTVGSKLNVGLADTLPDAKRGSDNRLIVDEWMRPSSLPNVFAAGDAADNGDLMTIVAISRQAPWLAKLLKAVAAGQSVESLSPYKPWGKAPLLVPLGPKRGSSFLMIATMGDWITSMMKGRDLFISKYRKLLGQA